MRSWLRHEQHSVRIGLVAALHSAGSRETKVEMQQLPGQTTGARTREGEVHEENDAPRRQNTPRRASWAAEE